MDVHGHGEVGGPGGREDGEVETVLADGDGFDGVFGDEPGDGALRAAGYVLGCRIGDLRGGFERGVGFAPAEVPWDIDQYIVYMGEGEGGYQ